MQSLLKICAFMACLSGIQQVTASDGIDCYACPEAPCDTVCNDQPTAWCDNKYACIITVKSDPSYHNDWITKGCNETCLASGANSWYCLDPYCNHRIWCCDYDLCNQYTPKRPIPASPEAPVGPKGYPGPPGPAGLAGAAGPKGAQGGPGPKGPVGPKGHERLQGEPGDPGPPGATGPPGPNGPAGPKGPIGGLGPVGPPGPYGHKGPDGPQGDKGETGPEGGLGFPGPNGAPGDRGNKGAKGPSETGPQGDPGEDGWPGAPGNPLPGEKGQKGPVGPPGVRGRKGDKGPDGTCTCNPPIVHVCFTVIADFIFNMPPEEPPITLFVFLVLTYVDTFDVPGQGLEMPFTTFVAPVGGLYAFFIVSVAECNFATSVELYYQAAGSGVAVFVIRTGRNPPDNGQSISIGVIQVVLCLDENDSVFISAEAPDLPHPDDPMDPWEDNSPSTVTFTGCLHTAGPCLPYGPQNQG